MGRSSPSAPTVIMPAPATPTTYQSVVPLQSYQMLAEQMNRYQNETAKIQEQRYQEVGTPAEIGARSAGRRMQEAASYLSSLPTSDRYMRELAGSGADQFEPAKQAARSRLSEAQIAYAEALKNIGEKPRPTIDETPMWARETIKEAG